MGQPPATPSPARCVCWVHALRCAAYLRRAAYLHVIRLRRAHLTLSPTLVGPPWAPFPPCQPVCTPHEPAQSAATAQAVPLRLVQAGAAHERLRRHKPLRAGGWALGPLTPSLASPTTSMHPPCAHLSQRVRASLVARLQACQPTCAPTPSHRTPPSPVGRPAPPACGACPAPTTPFPLSSPRTRLPCPHHISPSLLSSHPPPLPPSHLSLSLPPLLSHLQKLYIGFKRMATFLVHEARACLCADNANSALHSLCTRRVCPCVL